MQHLDDDDLFRELNNNSEEGGHEAMFEVHEAPRRGSLDSHSDDLDNMQVASSPYGAGATYEIAVWHFTRLIGPCVIWLRPLRKAAIMPRIHPFDFFLPLCLFPLTFCSLKQVLLIVESDTVLFSLSKAVCLSK